jgi:tight adherence protein B
MTDADSAQLLAPALAAIGAATFVCALFYPLLFRPPLIRQRSAMFEALLKGSASEVVQTSRVVRRAQESALKSVAPQGHMARLPQIEAQLKAAGLDWTMRRYMSVCCSLATSIFTVATAFGLSAATALGAAAIGAWFLPQRYVAFRARQRKQAFLKAFASAVDMIVRGAKSGLALTDCLAIVAGDAEEPVRSEFEAILAQLKAGVPLASALDKLATAMPAAEVRFFVLIMSMQSQTGGNLSEALANLSSLLRDRDKIASKVRVASAEVRASALIIGALPVCVIAATAVFAPDYISMLWADAAGRRIAGFCALWLIAGVVVLRQMARIEV